MAERNLGIRLSVNGGDAAKKQMIDFGNESQQAFEKVAQATNASSKGITAMDKAISAAESAFKRTTNAAEIYQQASQRLAEQHKQGAINVAQYQGTMAELDKRFRQASAAAKMAEMGKSGDQASLAMRTLGAVSGELQGGLVALSGHAGVAGNVLSSLGVAGLAAAAGVGAIAFAAHNGLADFMAAEEAGIRLEATLRATGNAARLTSGEIKDYAENLERQTKFSAEQIEDASAVMLTFKSITGDTFLRAQTAAADLAAVMKSDLSGATLQLGKALENPVEGITALKRAGVCHRLVCDLAIHLTLCMGGGMVDEDIIRRIVKEAVLEVLEGLGFDTKNLRETQADLHYLHNLRRGSEELPAKIKASIITVLVPTFLYVAWEAFKSKIIGK